MIKRFGIILTLLLSLTIHSFGALTFDGVDDYIETSETSGLYLPDGDWTIYVMVQVPDNAGAANKFIYNTLSGDFPSSGFIDQYVVQDSHATTSTRGDLWTDYGDDGNDTSGDFGSSGTPPFTGNTAWTSVFLQRSGNTVTQYVGSTTGNGSFTNASFDGVTPTGLYIGARFDLEATRFFKGNVAEYAIWGRALSTAEMSGLIKGFAPNLFLRGLQFHYRMLRDFNEIKSNAIVTNHGATVSSHPRVLYPN